MDAETAALLERADSLRRAGRSEEAIAAYEKLLEREPDLPDSWYNLGWVQRQARRYEAALKSYAQALDRHVRDPEEVHLNRAVILSDHLARPEEAKRELEAALALNPHYLPALLNLGNLHEDRGERRPAEEVYRRALTVAPGNPLALSRLAGVAEAGSEASGELIEKIREQLSGRLGAAERADLGFALGRLLDSRGDYPQAFAAYEAANRASRESFGPSFRGYDRAGHERYIDRLIDAFAEPARNSGTAVEAPRSSEEAAPRQLPPPIFICGMFRSGSTLVEQIIGAHSRVTSGGELDLIPALVQRISGYPEAVAAADEATIASWRDFYLDGTAPIIRGDSLITDKRPDNFLHIGLIKTLFPQAKIVHTRRNRLDNLLSLFFLHLNPQMAYALDLDDAAHWYGQYERLMAHWKGLYSNDIFDVDYDELVRGPRPVIEPLLDFLGLECEDSLLDFHRAGGTVKTASVWQVREPLHARSSGRWKNYSAQLSKLLPDEAGPTRL